MNAIDTNVLVYWADADGGDKRTIADNLLRRLQQASQPTVLLWQAAVEFLKAQPVIRGGLFGECERG